MQKSRTLQFFLLKLKKITCSARLQLNLHWKYGADFVSFLLRHCHVKWQMMQSLWYNPFLHAISPFRPCARTWLLHCQKGSEQLFPFYSPWAVTALITPFNSESSRAAPCEWCRAHPGSVPAPHLCHVEHRTFPGCLCPSYCPRQSQLSWFDPMPSHTMCSSLSFQ